MEKMCWAYIAGFFDGEGCLHHVGVRKSDKFGNHFRITISQTQYEVLEEIALFLNEAGIAAYVLRHKHSKLKYKGHWKQLWNVWITQRRSVSMFIDGVMPYLRVKREKAIQYHLLVGAAPVMTGQTQHTIKIRRDVLKRLLEIGRSLAEIAQMYGMDYSSVWKKVKLMGLPVPTITESNKARSKVSIEQLIADFNELGEYQEVAKKYGWRSGNVKKRLVEAGVQVNPDRRPGKQKNGGRYCPPASGNPIELDRVIMP